MSLDNSRVIGTELHLKVAPQSFSSGCVMSNQIFKGRSRNSEDIVGPFNFVL